MKKTALIWIATLMLCGINGLSLHANLNEPNDVKVIDLARKFYVSADQIRFANNTIYIKLQEDLVYETPSIFSDEEGYYIEKIASSGKCRWNQWQCERCGWCNQRGIDWKCSACGFSISY